MSAHSENVKAMIVWALQVFAGPHAKTVPLGAIDALVERSESSADFLIAIRDAINALLAEVLAGQTVALDGATLAALENITVNNEDFPDAATTAKLELIRALLAGAATEATLVGISAKLPSLGKKSQSASQATTNSFGTNQLSDASAGALYTKTVTVAAGGAGNYSAHQIVNPAGSGKTVVIYAMQCNTAGAVQLTADAALLGTDNGVFKNTTISAAGSTARIYSDNTSAVLSASDFFITATTAGNPGTAVGASIFVLPAGHNLKLTNQTANAAFTFTATVCEY
ncbi:MAG: hypothetical protein PSX71_14100 [bacterium]|nr:hypothetical protein [bacterium]